MAAMMGRRVRHTVATFTSGGRPMAPQDISVQPTGQGESRGGRAPKATDRDVHIDALRCLAIVMVVATHVLGLRSEFQGVAPGLVRVMVEFNMPLFAFLSGWVLVGREGSHPLLFLRGKALALFVPYLAWVAVELPLRHVAAADLMPRLFSALVDPHAGLQMWFLPVLFWMFVVFTAGRLVSRTTIWTAAVGIAVGALLLFPVPHTLGLDKIAWLYPFLVLGYLAARYRDRPVRFLLVAAGVAAVALGLAALGGHAGVATRFAQAIAWMAAAAAIYAAMPRPLLDAQSWIGRRTLGVYGAQMVLLPYLIVGSGWPGAVASWGLVTAASSAAAIGLEKFSLTRSVFLGRWPRPRGKGTHDASAIPAPAVKERHP